VVLVELKVNEGWSLECFVCGRAFEEDVTSFLCPSCGGLLQLIKTSHLDVDALFPRNEGRLTLWRYRRALPFDEGVEPVTLGEGGTGLVRSVHIGKGLGMNELFIKYEGQNPTGSFKDRGMTVAVTRARQSGAKVLICASTGNTSASLAAYSARAGLRSAVVVPHGKVASGKLAQAVAHGSEVLIVRGDFDFALSMTMEFAASDRSFYLMNSLNPYRIEGQKTVAFEIFEQLGNLVPDYIVLPVGNAGNISAIWKGFKELKAWGIADRTPKMIGVQAAGASPIAEAYAKGSNVISRWEKPSTIATAIRIGNPVSWMKALAAIRESRGMAMAVTDEEILVAKKMLASKEGLLVEAASAAPIAALNHLAPQLEAGALVVCIATGHGLKDQTDFQPSLLDAPIYQDKEQVLAALKRISAFDIEITR
jgi:threonine synthase